METIRKLRTTVSLHHCDANLYYYFVKRDILTLFLCFVKKEVRVQKSTEELQLNVI